VASANEDGNPNPFHCPTSPRCEHYWWTTFTVNRRRYRITTETSDKRVATNIEASERRRILEGRHGIRRLPDLTFREFASVYLRDHAQVNNRRPQRAIEIVARLNMAFGPQLLHEITGHRIEQWKRERRAGRWRAHGQKTPSNTVKPATVNRELDVLKSILAKAVEWGKLLESPAKHVKRLEVENRRTRILSTDEQEALLAAACGKARAFIALALITGARAGELLNLPWEQVTADEMTFLQTKNGRKRTIPLTSQMKVVLDTLPRASGWVFFNPRSQRPFTVNGMRHVVRRAYARAGITSGDVNVHTLRHTALSRMIATGSDVVTVMEIAGHSTIRMLERYAHSAAPQKTAALESASLGTIWAQLPSRRPVQRNGPVRTGPYSVGFLGGRREARTRGLRIANAALSQLS
jgi:integrase